ncbi:Biofilm growth-associated repressor [Streptomyces sp. YIM 130001]|nr:Biofilm growth-associated repressor [Streptomyces sp. YIM 130001]
MSIDISGLRTERITCAVSPLAELGMALHALGEPGHHPSLRGWSAGVSSCLDPCLADRISEADFLWRTTFSDVFLPFAGLPGREAAPGGTLAEELDQLDKLTDRQFVDAALEFTCGYPDSHPGPDVLSDPAARRRALDLAAARGPHQVAFTHRLLDEPPAVRGWLRRLLEECDEAFFADVWARLRPELAADVRHKKELLKHRGLADALASVSRAVDLDEQGTRITVDKFADGHTTTGSGGLAMVPTSLGRPHLMVLHRYGWQPVLHYPVAAEALTTRASVDQLTRRMEALAHPVRIRLCRYLARGAYTTGELADSHGMTAPEISRHLTVLKKAGLLTTQRRGRYVLHQLDLTTVARLGGDFIENVLR